MPKGVKKMALSWQSLKLTFLHGANLCRLSRALRQDAHNLFEILRGLGSRDRENKTAHNLPWSMGSFSKLGEVEQGLK